MLLKSLEIQGFKSFPDKIKLCFDRGITAVVGPNGCGKSNISDAMRWVMGEQSTKNLRGERMEDVVFYGTDSRKPQGFAEVTITVDNSDRRISFDADEVSITRRYFRSGDSEYKINGSAVRLRDIHELLMDTGLGRDGYSIISQGKITSIVDTRSSERREIFEEAAGISKYRYRKEEAEKKLSQTEDNLIRLRDILTELESRVEPLRIQSEKAQQFLEYAGEKKSLEIGLWLSTLDKAVFSLRDWESKLDIAKVQHEQAAEELAGIATRIETVFAESAASSAKADELARSSSELENEALKLENDAALCKNDILHNEQLLKKLDDDLDLSTKSFSEIDDRITEKRRAALSLEHELAEHNKKYLDTSKTLERLVSGVADFTEQIEELSKKLNSISFSASDANATRMTAQAQLEEASVRLENLIHMSEQFDTRLSALNSELEDTNDALEKNSELSSSLTNTADGLMMKLQSKKSRLEKLSAQASNISLDLGEKQRRIRILRDLEKNLDGFAFSVKTVMKNSENGILRGIHGPLSQLIDVPEEYAVAVETALGAAVNHIVTSTEDDAKNAIKFLKKSDAGKATFLPLTTIKGKTLEERGLSSHEGFIGIASELIKFDTKYKNVINSGLARVVVASDIDCAVSIARSYGYRFRIVTLDGQQVNAGGSLTGGSLNKNAGLLGRKSKIQKLSAETEELSGRLDEISKLTETAKNEVSECNALLITAQDELKTAAEDRIRFESEKKRILLQIEELKSTSENAQSECLNTENKISQLKAELEKAISDCRLAEVETEHTEQRLSEVNSERDKLTSDRENISEQLQKMRLDIFSLEKSIEAANLSINETLSLKTDMEKRRTEILLEKEALAEKNISLHASSEQLLARASELREKYKSAQNEAEQLRSRRMELDRQASELRAFERTKNAEHELSGRELARLEERRNNISKQYDDIIRKLWDDYEMTRSEAEAFTSPVENIPKAQKRLNELKGKIKSLGNVNVDAIVEYKEVYERYQMLSEQVSDVEKSKRELIKLITGFTERMREIFSEKFNLINTHFSAVFSELFGGGTAHLELADPDDILNCPIDILACPPGKQIGHLESMSGGEKALVAISIYFSILMVNPSPFCVLDEIEAALDDVNVDRYASYLRKMCHNTQFITITHRRGTMEEADIIYGVTMQEKGVSKLLELRVSELENIMVTPQ